MAELDLKDALQMFQNGAKQLMFSRALGDANTQVQNIKASEASEQDKRAQLQQLSNGLVMHMAGMGIADTTIESVKNAVGPAHFGNANAMNMYGIETGNKDLMNQATQQQAFEQNPQYKIAALQAKAEAMNPMRMQAADEKKQEFATKQLGELNKNLDTTAASSRSAFGLGGQTLVRADRIKALMGSPANWNNMNGQDATLVAEGLSNLVKGGVATEQEIKALVPRTTGTLKSDVQQFLSNKPQGAQLQAFMAKYYDILDRETKANQMTLQDTVLKRASGAMQLLRSNPQAEDQFKITVAQNLTQNGLPTKPEDVNVDLKKGVSTVQMDKMNEDLNLAKDALKKSYKDLHSNDPEARIQAMKRFSVLHIDPSNTPPGLAARLIETRLRTGVYGQ